MITTQSRYKLHKRIKWKLSHCFAEGKIGHADWKRLLARNLRRCERTRTCEDTWEHAMDNTHDCVSNATAEADRIRFSGGTTILTSRRWKDVFTGHESERRATWREDSAVDHRRFCVTCTGVTHTHTQQSFTLFVLTHLQDHSFWCIVTEMVPSHNTLFISQSGEWSEQRSSRLSHPKTLSGSEFVLYAVHWKESIRGIQQLPPVYH